MGYITKYTVTASEDIPNFNDVLLEYSGGYHFFYGCMEGQWYKHTEDMKKLSADYPCVIFNVLCIGEEHDDMWVKYFFNGKVQEVKARITFESFDEGKLK